MAKTEKTPEQKLASVERFLKKEIKGRRDILDDPFMQSNMMHMELAKFALEMGVFESVLERVKK